MYTVRPQSSCILLNHMYTAMYVVILDENECGSLPHGKVLREQDHFHFDHMHDMKWRKTMKCIIYHRNINIFQS